MTARQSSPESPENVRKRVCKACDRCRLKKSKCDGSSPCGRCRADNAICVFGERKKAHDKVYPKGYVEMLEQQQSWLVHGLQEMYRRACDGQGWPGEPLRCEPNGHPLTHDLLTRLGALDHTKGERFEENPDHMQQDLWRRRQDSSDASSEAQSPVVSSQFNSDVFASQQMPPTPPSFSPSSSHAHPTPKSEQQQQQQQQQHPQSQLQSQSQSQQQQGPQGQGQGQSYAQMSMQGVVDPVALQGPQWSNNGFDGFDDMDLMGSTEYSNMSFDDPMASSPMFNRQVPMNCISSASFLDTKNDYDEFNQFLNPNPTEITSI